MVTHQCNPLVTLAYRRMLFCDRTDDILTAHKHRALLKGLPVEHGRGRWRDCA